MKIFGIGLNKTGTTSLGQAFSLLGYRHFKRSPHVFRLYRESKHAAIFEHIASFDSFEDWPWPLMVTELLDHYGGAAKFVLSRRKSPQVWLESLKAHALRTHPKRNPRAEVFGAPYPQGNETLYLDFYKRHLDETRRFFQQRTAGDQLLEVCWEEGQGWPELCGFLNQQVPDCAFPHANVTTKVKIPEARLAENLAGIEAQFEK